MRNFRSFNPASSWCLVYSGRFFFNAWFSFINCCLRRKAAIISPGFSTNIAYQCFLSFGIFIINPFFIASHNSIKNDFLRVVRAAIHKMFFCFSSYLALNLYGNQFPAFWTRPRLCKRSMYQTIVRGSDSDLHRVTPPSFYLQLRSKSPLLNHLNQSLHIVSDRECSRYAFWSRRWLTVPKKITVKKIKAKMESFPHICCFVGSKPDIFDV